MDTLLTVDGDAPRVSLGRDHLPMREVHEPASFVLVIPVQGHLQSAQCHVRVKVEEFAKSTTPADHNLIVSGN